ncbi:hypothetical protein CKO28_17435 [Rhodovibrio sodomensis]|uniref:Uncharacterized protein n=1 Tax=Rhodovibrio sodomensis TaxID=1088 RepID=A0ABS1DIJ9_9PROT|nr:hypothetical protein [Rhodovibrio sodomensis]MBK1669821.1 hypothetical protein [Rhodovibrio sodomensis]
MSDTGAVIPKQPVHCRVVLKGGETLRGTLFARPDQRITDILNDSRDFLPFEHDNGEFEALSKGLIDRAKPVNPQKATQVSERHQAA